MQPVTSTSLSLRIALTAAVFWLVARLAILAYVGQPQPYVCDEMAYLLGADTFAHGRLTNPPLALGRFFESPYVLVTPTYAPKYPPGQSLWLALGQKTFGTPFAGVILEGFAMIFSFGLMFGAWVSAKWAWIFSFISALCFQWPMYWTNSYWGGCAAAIGAALVLTAVGWFRAEGAGKRIFDPAGFLLAMGLVMLFLTRPYEGGVFALALFGSLFLLRRPWWRWRAPALTALPVLLAGFGWSLYYDKAVTGNPWQLPYLLHEKLTTAVPSFWFLPLRPEPKYDQPRLALQEGVHGADAEAYHSDRLHLSHVVLKVVYRVISVMGPLFGFVVLVPLAWSDDRCRFLVPPLVVCFLGSCLPLWAYAHYLAPLLTALLLLSACVADSGALADGKWGRRCWAIALVIGSAVFSIIATARGFTQIPRFGLERPAMMKALLKVPGKHLVLVHYEANVPAAVEWVYNSADLDSQRVILAHDLGRAEDKLLEDHYPDRKVWVLNIAFRDPNQTLYSLRRLEGPE